ncbi:receptor-type tyrosine-protein phosphatase N2-like [Ciona intestinalis]
MFAMSSTLPGWLLNMKYCVLLFVCYASVISCDQMYGCLYRASLCRQPNHYCYNDGRTGLCKVAGYRYQTQFTSTPNKNGNEESFYSTPRRSMKDNVDSRYRRLPVAIFFIVKDVQGYLADHNLKLSDLSKVQFDTLAAVLARLIVKKHEYYERNENFLISLLSQTKELLKEHGLKFSQLTEGEIKALSDALARICIKNRNRCHFTSPYINMRALNASLEILISSQNVPPISNSQIHSDNILLSEQQTPAEDLEIVNLPVADELNDVNPVLDKVTKPLLVTKKSDKIALSALKQDNAQVKSAADKEKSQKSSQSDSVYLLVIIILCSLAILLVVVCALVYCLKTKENDLKLERESTDVAPLLDEHYQELCRQHYASKSAEQSSQAEKSLSVSSHNIQSPILTSKLNQQQASPRSSICSWSEEPITTSLDVSTGHAVLSYMEDHLSNKGRLNTEWEELCKYQADNVTTEAAAKNMMKNRSTSVLPYDNNRVKLKPSGNGIENDFINASYIVDNDPRWPVYIATQGPLSSTVHQFWQMVWEQGCAVIVMLTPVSEDGISQCARYWPDEGSCNYANFEIHLVSEHIWCEDYLVRSLYLKNICTGETRTVTQFHFLSWPVNEIPFSPKPLLELRRKVSKCYKGSNSPIIVHCNDGSSRSGTYILIDLVITRMVKGAKEIDVAATLEYLRDQRMGMVASKQQMEFALTAVAEEVNGILKSLLN